MNPQGLLSKCLVCELDEKAKQRGIESPVSFCWCCRQRRVAFDKLGVRCDVCQVISDNYDNCDGITCYKDNIIG